MKRELKHNRSARIGPGHAGHCRAYPDEKGIETVIGSLWCSRGSNCRAYPDEKGIETLAGQGQGTAESGNCRAYPDEKGIETRCPEWQTAPHSRNCRAYPDEKGIETLVELLNVMNLKVTTLQSLSR